MMMLKISAAMSKNFTVNVMAYILLIHKALPFFMTVKRFELSSAALVKAAEHLIIFQTQYLDSHDQSFQSADYDISDHQNNPVRRPFLCTRKHQHHLHDGSM